MHEKLQELLDSDDFDGRAELEKEFLQETIETLSSRDQESALDVAAQFDRFKKQAAGEGEEFYNEFFDVLSQLIKRKYLGRDQDFSLVGLEDF